MIFEGNIRVIYFFRVQGISGSMPECLLNQHQFFTPNTKEQDRKDQQFQIHHNFLFKFITSLIYSKNIKGFSGKIYFYLIINMSHNYILFFYYLLNFFMKNNRKEKQLTEHQILKKISKAGVSSAEEYELIIRNLQYQNMKLMNDREQLKIRVEILVEKQKQLLQEQSSKVKKYPNIDYTRLKNQLQQKYKQFQVWQKKCYNSLNKGALNIQMKDYLNQCALVEAEIVKQRVLLNDQKRTFKTLQKSIKGELKYLNKNVPHREVLEEENKQLRRMIWNLRIVQDLTGHVEVRLHNSIVSLHSKKKFIQKLKTMTIQDIKRQEAKNKIQIIDEQIKLKRGREVRQSSIRRFKTQSRAQSSLSKQKTHQSSLENIEIKQKLAEEKMVESNRLKQELDGIQFQMVNLINERDKLNSTLELQQKQKTQRLKQKPQSKQLCDVNVQVNVFEDQDPLPVQIIGNETGLLQNDRLILKNAKDTLISGIIVYENKIGLSCMRALYSNGKQTACLPPEQYLNEKCKQKKIVLSDPKDYLKWIKAYYDKCEKKLVRLQIYSNNKIKFQIGKQKQLLLKNVISYKFDNSTHQIPVCLRVSYLMIEKEWIMTSMGVQINQK